MHATHQFFLSKRSLYILVLDGRKDEKTEYWLKHIESFGGDSPILIALNKMDDNPSFDLNRKFLQEKHKSIRGFFRTSCKKNSGIDQLRESLLKQLLGVELVKTTWPKSWFNVKTNLENLNKNYISHSDYIQICNKEKVNEEARDVLLGLIRDLGIFLHFDNLSLRDTNVINPKWITEAVYKIINCESLARSGGILKLSVLDQILDKKIYPQDKHNYIIELMKKFELCYSIDHDTVLIPDLLMIEEPDFKPLGTPVKFVIEYAFLPKTIMPRFIVRMHNHIKGDLLWRTGVVIEDANSYTTALVRSDENDRKILISVYGKQKRDFLSHIRHVINDINDKYEKIYPKEMITLPDNEDFCIEYRELVGQEIAGKTEIFIGVLQKEYSIPELLNGVEERENTERIIKELYKIDRMRERFFTDYYEKNTIHHVKNAGGKDMRKDEQKVKNNPWKSGSFYILLFIVALTVVVTVSKFLPPYVLPIVLISAILFVSIIGFFQLRNDGCLSENGFIKLMTQTFSKLPLLKKISKNDKNSSM